MRSLALGSSFIYAGLDSTSARSLQYWTWCENSYEIASSRKCTACSLGTYKASDNPRLTTCTTCSSKPKNSQWVFNATQSCYFDCVSDNVKSGSLCSSCDDIMKGVSKPDFSVWIIDSATQTCKSACPGGLIFADGCHSSAPILGLYHLLCGIYCLCHCVCHFYGFHFNQVKSAIRTQVIVYL